MLKTISLNQYRVNDQGFSPELSRIIKAACEEEGFIFLADHGVPESLTNTLRESMREFFDRSSAEKGRYAINKGADHRGYFSYEVFNPDADHRGDLCEGFKIYTGPSEVYGNGGIHLPRAIWPDNSSALREAVSAYWVHMNRLYSFLLPHFAVALGLPPSIFDEFFAFPLDNISLLHYPPSEGRMGISPHSDTDALTIIHPDPTGGLHLKVHNGDWVEIPYRPECLVLNIGDMMHIWSGGRFLSTPHYVQNKALSDRYSFPFFVAPSPGTTVQPLLDPLKDFSMPSLKVCEVPEYRRLLALT